MFTCVLCLCEFAVFMFTSVFITQKIGLVIILVTSVFRSTDDEKFLRVASTGTGFRNKLFIVCAAVTYMAAAVKILVLVSVSRQQSRVIPVADVIGLGKT